MRDPELITATLQRIAAAELSDPASDDLTIPLAIENGELMGKIQELRAALKPLAALSLWSDEYPDCQTDFVTAGNLFTVAQIKAARAALEQKAAKQ